VARIKGNQSSLTLLFFELEGGRMQRKLKINPKKLLNTLIVIYLSGVAIYGFGVAYKLFSWDLVQGTVIGYRSEGCGKYSNYCYRVKVKYYVENQQYIALGLLKRPNQLLKMNDKVKLFYNPKVVGDNLLIGLQGFLEVFFYQILFFVILLFFKYQYRYSE